MAVKCEYELRDECSHAACVENNSSACCCECVYFNSCSTPCADIVNLIKEKGMVEVPFFRKRFE